MSLSPRQRTSQRSVRGLNTTLKRPEPTVIQPLPTPHPSSSPLKRKRNFYEDGETLSLSSPLVPIPESSDLSLASAPRTRRRHHNSLASATSSEANHLPTPVTGIRPRSRLLRGAQPNTPSTPRQQSPARTQSSPLAPLAARKGFNNSPAALGVTYGSPRTLWDSASYEPWPTSPVHPGDDDENPFTAHRQDTKLISQTLIPTSQTGEMSLAKLRSPGKPLSSLASPTTGRLWRKSTSRTIVPSSQMWENSLKISPARPRISVEMRNSPSKKETCFENWAEPATTVVPSSQTPSKHPLLALSGKDHVILADEVAPSSISPPRNGNHKDNAIPTSQSQSEEEFADMKDSLPALVPSSQTQPESDWVVSR
jgi:hypothetical protein